MPNRKQCSRSNKKRSNKRRHSGGDVAGSASNYATQVYGSAGQQAGMDGSNVIKSNYVSNCGGGSKRTKRNKRKTGGGDDNKNLPPPPPTTQRKGGNIITNLAVPTGLLIANRMYANNSYKYPFKNQNKFKTRKMRRKFRSQSRR
jgi:hypothetical protein